MPLAPSTIIDDRYQVETLLGEGAMAEVYRVKHTQLGTTHALKVLKLEGENIYERFLREGQVQAKLNHPNIVAVSDIVKVGKEPGLVMEYVDGSSLDLLLSTERLTLKQVDHLARGIIAGVAAAHGKGLIHRDLKPANILLALDGKRLVPKVTDFGLAKAMDNSSNWNSTKSGVMMGTPAYMAPEQILDAKRVDARADIFSLGAILFHMVCGRRPFDQRTVADTLGAVLDGARPRVIDLAPDLPPFRIAAIDAALEVDRDKRVATCKELLAMWTGEYQANSLQEHVPFDSEVFKRLMDAGQGIPLHALGADASTVPYVNLADPNAQTLLHHDEPTEELPKGLADVAPPPPVHQLNRMPPGARSSANISRAELRRPGSKPAVPKQDRTNLIVLGSVAVLLILLLSLIGGILSGTLTALLLRGG